MCEEVPQVVTTRYPVRVFEENYDGQVEQVDEQVERLNLESLSTCIPWTPGLCGGSGRGECYPF